MEKYKILIETAFENAENHISKITDDIIHMEGMTGTKTRHFYNNLLNMEDVRYLEIGSWKGSSICSAIYGNKTKSICIDNWSEFYGPKDEFLQNLEKYKGENDVLFFESDCYDVDVSSLPKINFYMYDGNHSIESHYKSLTYFYDCFDDIFVFVVDDWNCPEVRTGTENAIKDLKLDVLYQREIRLTFDNTHSPQPLAKETWWNGMYVAILQKSGL